MRLTVAAARASRSAWWPAILLGLATIGAYGTTYYAIGVLIPVIAEDTGWGTGVLASAFSVGVLGQAPVALLAGRVFDRHGSAPILVSALVVGCTCLLLSSFATSPAAFVVPWALGAAVISGGLQYNVTMPATARLYPERRSAALGVLTFLGALASPIFYPVAGWLVEAHGWETAIRALVALSALFAAPAALLVRAPRAATRPQGSTLAALRLAARTPAIARLLVHFALGSAASSALLLFQFSAFQAAGLAVGVASTMAGVRGLMQIPGRLAIAPLVGRFGLSPAVAASHGAALLGTMALVAAIAGGPALPLAIAFAAIAGMSLGLLSPLNGLMQAEVYGDARLGTLSGATVLVTSAATASGAWLVGAVVDGTGSTATGLLAVAAGQALAILALGWQRRAAAAEDGPGPWSHSAGTPAS
ncbi:MAG: MFS transporter [Dehalococcoidia bacterium]